MAANPLANSSCEGYNNTRKADKFISERISNLLRLDKAGRYIDVGCGTGNYTIGLEKLADCLQESIRQRKCWTLQKKVVVQSTGKSQKPCTAGFLFNVKYFLTMAPSLMKGVLAGYSSFIQFDFSFSINSGELTWRGIPDFFMIEFNPAPTVPGE
jgi:hypothetical protein